MREIESEPSVVIASTAESPSKSTFPPLLAAASLGILTFRAYFPILRFQFVHDDRTVVLKNLFLSSWRFFSSLFSGRDLVHATGTCCGNSRADSKEVRQRPLPKVRYNEQSICYPGSISGNESWFLSCFFARFDDVRALPEGLGFSPAEIAATALCASRAPHRLRRNLRKARHREVI